MALEKNVVYRQTVDEYGNISVLAVTQILEDGVLVAEKNHRHVVAPGDATTDEDDVTKEIAKAVHTAEVIAAHEARMAALAGE